MDPDAEARLSMEQIAAVRDELARLNWRPLEAPDEDASSTEDHAAAPETRDSIECHIRQLVQADNAAPRGWNAVSAAAVGAERFGEADYSITRPRSEDIEPAQLTDRGGRESIDGEVKSRKSSLQSVRPPSSKPESYTRIVLPSDDLARRFSRNEENVKAVTKISRALTFRTEFVESYRAFDSPCVLPPQNHPTDLWGSREPRFCPDQAPIYKNLRGYSTIQDGVVHVYTDLCPETLQQVDTERQDSRSVANSSLRVPGIRVGGADFSWLATHEESDAESTPNDRLLASPPQQKEPWGASDPDVPRTPMPNRTSTEEVNEEGWMPNLMELTGAKLPSVEEYLSRLTELMQVVQNPACKSFCYQRLKYLEEKFSFHMLFNGLEEQDEVRNNSHRDFYNVRKVDTHVHHSACMTQKHLLRFIRRKYRTCANEVVCRSADGTQLLTLQEVFENMIGLTAWETSIDHLNVHAMNSCFHRFDLFNSKYNPFGAANLREVFLKTDNLVGGKYLAELTHEVIEDLEAAKYQHVEWRISIYGHSRDEWIKLARWILNHKLQSKRVRWMIQVPRLYHIYRRKAESDSNVHVKCFQDMLDNIFAPVIDAVLRPQEHPEIFQMLWQVVGWDSVDDESVVSKFTMAGGDLPLPQNWTSLDNPPYAYWMYYMYANIRVLNTLLQARGLNAMPFRPHCGEAGSISHLASCGLLADGINHGIMLRKSPVLQYLYYCWQIGLALSPLSNNALFHEITKSPFVNFFKIGLNVSLSSDDPLMFHFTDEALLEEYSVCAHVWKLSPVDLCEIARNSVLQSNFEPQFKRHWLGTNFDKKGAHGNDMRATNVPDIRLSYREETLKEELKFLRDVVLTNGPQK